MHILPSVISGHTVAVESEEYQQRELKPIQTCTSTNPASYESALWAGGCINQTMTVKKADSPWAVWKQYHLRGVILPLDTYSWMKPAQ